MDDENWAEKAFQDLGLESQKKDKRKYPTQAECHGISVEAVMNGFIVTIGCQRAVFTSYGDLMAALEEIKQNPLEVEMRWMRETKVASEKLQHDLEGNE